MGNGFVLRNTRGTPVGYLMQGLDAIRCRIRHTEADEVVVFLQDGSHRRRRIEHAGEEMEWREKECVANGAVALEDGRLCAATGEDARRKWLEMDRGKMDKEKKEQEEKAAKAQMDTADTEQLSAAQREQKKGSKEPDDKAEAGAKKAQVWPQRRWPPPPCLKTAVYRDGFWKEEEI